MKTKSSSAFSPQHLAFAILAASALFLPTFPAMASTVAYWRFEEGPADAQVFHGGQPAGVFCAGTFDSSGNGNALSVWAEDWAGYAYRTDVQAATIPRTGEPNNFSVQNSGGYPTLFTSPSSPMQTMTPAAFTIEASFKPESGGWRTIVGRDSRGETSADTNLAALYLQITPDNAVAIKYCDLAGFWHEVISAPGIIQGFNWGTDPDGLTGHWYHMAAVNDGSTLSLYLDYGFGCRLVAQTDLTLSGSPDTALTAGMGSGSDWVAGTWTVGRGLYEGGHTDRAFGFIDEVRISDTALSPEDFLFYRPPLPLEVWSTADDGPGSLRVALVGAGDGDTITFSNSLSGATILLTSGQLPLNKDVNIDGSALAGGITIDGNTNGRVFQVSGGHTVVLDSLTLAHGEADHGGSIHNAGELAVIRCTLVGNAARTNGGGIYNTGSLTVNRCTLVENSAGQWGGGIINEVGTLTVNQCTLTANTCGADGGAGIDVDGGEATVSQSTLTGNGPHGGGAGGVCVFGGSVTIHNSIVAGNSAPDIFGDPWSPTGSNLTDGVPLLAPLGNYGGPTPTMPPLPGSPAINACTSGTSFSTDQRGVGFPRIVGSFADIGAVEAGNPIPSLLVNTAADESDGLGTNGISLRDALAYAPSGSTITFAPALAGSTILLTNGQLHVSNSVSVLGPGPAGLTVSGNNASRVFNVTGTNVTISGLTIADGWTTNASGAGINAAGGPGSVLSLNNCVITNNTTTLLGGGIYNSAGVTLTISNCTISGNSAPSGNAGGIYNNSAALTVIASILNRNSAYQVGGGIMNDGQTGGATLRICGATLSSNSAWSGGAICNYGSYASATINASTFSGNSAGFAGGCIQNAANATVEIGNTILNAGTSGGNIYRGSGAVTSHGYNLCSDNGGGFLTNATDRVNTAPLLGPLQDNGGPTWTHALLPGSPAIDAGDDSVLALLTTDQRGFPRKSGAHVDIGSYESQVTTVTPPWLTSFSRSANGTVQFSFTNSPGIIFNVLATTNLALPASNWIVLPTNLLIESPPGFYQFTDPSATNDPQRYYRLRWP